MSENVRVIQTERGPLQVGYAHDGLIDALATLWPLPIATLVPREDAQTTHNRNATFILPFEHEGRPVNLVYLSLVPRSVPDAEATVAALRALSDTMLLASVRAGFPGFLLPIATIRRSGGVGVPGLAMVVGPGADSRDDDPNPLDVVLDVIAESGLPFELAVAPKFVPSSVVGELHLDFGLLEGRVLLCLRPELDPADPVFARLVAGGVEGLVHMPVVATEFPKLGAALPTPEAPPDELVEEVSPKGLRRIYRLVAHLAHCDGTVDPTERALLNGVAERFELSPAEIKQLEAEGFAGKELRVGNNPVERELLMMQLIEMAVVDGVLDPTEKKRLKAFADKVGLSRDDLRRRLDERMAGRDQRAVEAGSAPQTPQALRRIYRLLCYLAASDGAVGAEEERLLTTFRARYGLTEAEGAELRSQAESGQRLEVGKEPAERVLLLDELVAIAAADGEITQAEARRLRSFCKMLQVPVAELEAKLQARLQAGPDSEAPAPAKASAEECRVVLLDVPMNAVCVNLLQVPVSSGFRGFKHVEPGVHRFSVLLEEGEASAWVRLLPGEVEVLSFDGAELKREDARWTQVQRQAVKGELDDALQSFPVHLPWKRLTAPLMDIPFPPKVFVVPEPTPSSRLAEVLSSHEGSAGSVLGELAFSFLLGILDRDPRGLQRWLYLLQAFYHCGESVPKQAPTLFAWVVDLLIEQQKQLSPEHLVAGGPCAFGSHYLSEDLIDTEIPQLVEAGRRWGLFIAGHHAGAPPAPDVPAPEVQIEGPFADSIAEFRAQIEEIEGRLGPGHPEMLPPLSALSNIQEMAGDLRSSADNHARVLELGAAAGFPPQQLARGYGRLARLYRELGRPAEAQEAERTAQRLALSGLN